MSLERRSVLAASDLGEGSYAVVAAAAELARLLGAELHLLHALEVPHGGALEPSRSQGFPARVQAAENALAEQARRGLPSGTAAASAVVDTRITHKAILDRARDVGADVIVTGRHRGGALSAHFLGTTADRVVRSADVPCLLVGEPAPLRIRRIGVPVDFSGPAEGAFRQAAAWAALLGSVQGTPPSLHVMHVGWPVSRADHPELEQTVLLPRMRRLIDSVVGPEGPAATPEVVWADDPVEATRRWAATRAIDLLVMGTHGNSGLKRALIGSLASAIARESPCPVLLVPPSCWRAPRLESEPALERVVVGVDFSDSSLEAVRWAADHLAHDAACTLVYAVDLPRPPAVLEGRFGPRRELIETARAGAERRLEGLRAELRAAGVEIVARIGRPAEQIVLTAAERGADLIVLGGHGKHRGVWELLGNTAEQVIHLSRVPVLVARRLPDGMPRRIVVGIDGSDASRLALRWTRFLSERTHAQVTLVHAAGMADHPYAVRGAAFQREYLDPLAAWLAEQAEEAGFPRDAVELHAAAGAPGDELVAAAVHRGADLVVVGSRGRSAAARTLIGSVAGSVVRSAPGAVLVVPSPARLPSRSAA